MPRHSRVREQPLQCLLWAAAIGSALLGGGALVACAPGAEVEGISKVPMARKTVELYLGHLQAGSYAEAARLFGGPLEPLRQANPDLRPDDIAAFLERYMDSQGERLPRFRILEARLLSPICYPVEVEFRPGGDDPPFAQEFQVTFDGLEYKVLGLPVVRPRG